MTTTEGLTTEGHYEDLVDLLEYTEDHLKAIRSLLSASITGDDLDHLTAEITYAKHRLNQLLDELLDTYQPAASEDRP